jgi:hypothetical protein
MSIDGADLAGRRLIITPNTDEISIEVSSTAVHVRLPDPKMAAIVVSDFKLSDAPIDNPFRVRWGHS